MGNVTSIFFSDTHYRGVHPLSLGHAMQPNQGEAPAVPWYQLVHVCKGKPLRLLLARGTCGLVAPCQNHTISQQTHMARVPWLNLRVFADLELERRRRSSPTEPKRRVMWHFCPPFDDCGANHPLVMAHEPRAVCHRQQTFCSHHPSASCIPRGRKNMTIIRLACPSGPFFGRLLRHISLY